MGGGTVVEPHAKRHRRRHAPTLERLEVMERGSLEEDVLLADPLQSTEPCDAADAGRTRQPASAQADVRRSSRRSWSR